MSFRPREMEPERKKGLDLRCCSKILSCAHIQAPRPSVVARANSREALKHLVTHGKIPSNERIPSKRPRYGNLEAVPRTTRHPNAQKEQASNPVEDAKLEVRGRPPPTCAEHRTPWMARISRICQKKGNRPPRAERHARGPTEAERRGAEPPTDSILLAPEFPERRIAELASHLKHDAADRSDRTEGHQAPSLLLEDAGCTAFVQMEGRRTPPPPLPTGLQRVADANGGASSLPSLPPAAFCWRRSSKNGRGAEPLPPHLSRLPLPPLCRQFSEQAAMASTSS